MSLKDTCVSAWEALPTTIASGASLTDKIDLGGLRLFGIALPTAWTSASLSFLMSPDNGTTWYNLFDQDGTEISAMANTQSCVMLDPKTFASLQCIKIRSGSNAAPVAQTATRALNLIVRAV